MATTSKAAFIAEVQALLKKRYDPAALPEKFSVLEAVVFAICHEDATREQALAALARFRGDFFDWNEVRVSSLEEIQGVLAGSPDVEGRAFRLRRFLRQLFEKTYAFNLDALAKKPQKESTKALEEYDAFGSDYVAAAVTRLALGGHAIPVDAPSLRALRRLGIAEAEADAPAARAMLERAVPKNRGAEFADLVEELAHDTCVEGEPDCPRCELKKVCPTGQAYKEPAASAAATKAGGRGKSGGSGKSKGGD